MDNGKEKCAELEAWFRTQGGNLHPNISITSSALANCTHSSSGVHFCANGLIQPGEELASAPASITLSYLNALADDKYPIFQQQRHRFKVEAIGFWYLMIQYANRNQSFWKPYLDALPCPDSDLTQPLFFEDQDDIAYLGGTDAWYTAEARKEVYQQYYRDGLQILKEAGIDVEPYTW